MLGNQFLTMSKQRKFSLRERRKSFQYAIDGMVAFFRTENNAWLHLFGTVIVILLAAWVKVSRMETVFLVIVTGLVWVAELFNTAIEKIVDIISPDHHPRAKYIKDVAAGAVLVMAITALITGGIIFIPKIL